MTMRSAWAGHYPPLRHEVHFGRMVRCFPDRPAGFHAMLESAVARFPDEEALVCGEARFTWRQFATEAESWAAHLAAQGVTAGDRVVLFLTNRAEYPILLLAIARLGAISVPVTMHSRAPELAHIVPHCGAVMVIHDEALADRLPERAKLPAVRSFVSLGAATFLPPPATVSLVSTGEDDTVFILYTSGTTGRPKGAMLTNLNVVACALNFGHTMKLTQADRSVLSVPFSHITGVVSIFATLMQAGATLVMLPEFKAATFLETAARERMTHAVMVPAMYNLCLLNADFERFDLSAWRIGCFGAAPMPPSTVARFAALLPGLGLMNAYGATESSAPAVLMRPDLTAAHLSSAGTVLPGCDVLIMGEDGRELPQGETGEIWIAGANVIPGYWNDAVATAENIVGGYWRSGDLGYFDAEGFLFVADRKKDAINRGGYKIYSVEVENTLMEIPGMIECAVVAKPCPVLGERVHAFVRTSEPITEEAIRAFCAERLSRYKVPESVTLASMPLPRNPTGKLLKLDLRTQLAAAG